MLQAQEQFPSIQCSYAQCATQASDELIEELMKLLVEQPLIMETPVQAKAFAEMKIPMVFYCIAQRMYRFHRVHLWVCSKPGR